MISRVLGPEFVPAFELSVEPTLCDVGAPHGCFALRPGSGATTSVQVAGSSVSELTAGVGHYLRTVCNASLSWQGTGGNRVDQLRLPLPSPPTELRVRRADRWSYYQNVCTPSFSFVWYSWGQWEAGAGNGDRLRVSAGPMIVQEVAMRCCGAHHCQACYDQIPEKI